MRDLFLTFSRQHPRNRLWAVTLFAYLSFWAVVALALPAGLDSALNYADAPRLYVVVWLLALPAAAGVTLIALQRAARPPDDNSLALTGTQRALTAFNGSAIIGFWLLMGVAATPTDTHKLLMPLVITVWAVNAMLLWRRPVGALRPAVIGGAALVAAGVVALLLPVNIDTRLPDGVRIQAGAAGRLLTGFKCQTVQWDMVGVSEVKFGQLGQYPYQTLPSARVDVCRPYDANAGAEATTYIFEVRLPDESIHTEQIAFAAIHRAEWVRLGGAALVTVALPTLGVLNGAAVAVGLVFIAGLFIAPVVPVWLLAVAGLGVFPALWLFKRGETVLAHPAVRRIMDVAALVAVPLLLVNVALPIDRWQMNAWLAPVNDLIQGKTLFAETSSMYGVGSQYLLAGIFQFTPLPLSYTGLALLAYLLQAVILAALYGVLRRLTGSKIAPLLFLLGAGVLLVWRGGVTVSTHPQYGAIQYLVPVALLLAVFARTEFPQQARLWRGVEYGLAALAFAWNVQVWAVTWAAYLAVVAFEQVISAATWRAGVLRFGGHVLALVVGAGLLLGGFSVFSSGADLRVYFDYLTQFPGIPYRFIMFNAWVFIPLLLYGSLAAVMFQGLANPTDRTRLRSYIVPLMAAVIGIIQFAAWMNAPQPPTLATFSLMPLFVGAYWLGRLEAEPLAASTRGRVRGVLIYVLVVLIGAHLLNLPSSQTVQTPLSWVWRGYTNPVASEPTGRVAETLDLIEQYTPNAERVAVFIEPNDTAEVMLRGGLTHVWRTSYAPMEMRTQPTFDWVIDYAGYVPEVGDIVYAQRDDVGLFLLQNWVWRDIRNQMEWEILDESPSGVQVWQAVDVVPPPDDEDND